MSDPLQRLLAWTRASQSRRNGLAAGFAVVTGAGIIGLSGLVGAFGHGGYPGASVIDAQLTSGASTKRVGLVGLERVPVREGTIIVDAHGRKLGSVTSGTLAPTVNEPIAMAYLAANHALPQHEVYAEVRGKRQPMRVRTMPFAPHRYFRG